MAMSLKDHSDTWVNATTFTDISNAHLQGPGGVTAHSRLPCRASQPCKAVVHRGAPLSSQFVWAESAGNSVCLGGRATTGQDLSYWGERDPLARRGAYGRVP
jgi:hypothetical protein